MNKDVRMDKKHYAELEDHFLKHLGYEYTEFLCDELDQQASERKDIVIPESLNQWFSDFLKQERTRGKVQERKIMLMNYAKKAAIFFMFLIGVNYILVVNVDAYRVKWMNTVLHIKEKFTQIDIIHDPQDRSLSVLQDWGGLYYLTYLPKGYELTNTNRSESMAVMVYSNDQGKQLIFSQNKQKSATRIDSEKGIVKNVLLHGITEAVYLEKGDTKLLSWFLEDTAFQINSDLLSMDEMVKTAESVEIYK